MEPNRTRPTLTENNRIYLYRLLKDAIGCGKQTFITAVDEALAADDLIPQEIGYADTRELLEALGDFVKLTVFKGGRIYATLSAVAAWDEALAQPEKTSTKAAGTKGKSWKKKKGAKALKPQRPKRVKHDEPKPKPASANADGAQADSKTDNSAASDRTTSTAQPAAEDAEKSTDNEAVGAPCAETAQEAAADPEHATATTMEAVKAEEHDADSADESGSEAATPASKPAVGEGGAESAPQKPAGAPKTLSELLAAIENAETPADNDAEPEEAAAQPTETAQPRESVAARSSAPSTQSVQTTTATANAQAAPASPSAEQPARTEPKKPSAAVSESVKHAGTAPATESERIAASAPATPAPAAANAEPAAPAFDFKDYPVDFSREVFCPGDLLAELSALLPWGADALGIVGEYYWIARERNSIEATRSRASFALRYTRDGERHEATVTIKRRNNRDGAAWAIESVSGEDECKHAQ